MFLSVVGWGIIGAKHIWPALRGRPLAEALRPLLLLHAFRFVGWRSLYVGIGIAPGLQGADYFIPTVLVPLLLVLAFCVLRQEQCSSRPAIP